MKGNENKPRETNMLRSKVVIWNYTLLLIKKESDLNFQNSK